MTATGRKRRTLHIDDPVGPGGVTAADRPGGSAANGRLRELPIAEIHPNPKQPRKHFDVESLAALAESIRKRGVVQPVIVRPRPEGDYELVAGERRWRAASLAALATVPALVDEQLDGAASLEVALIENMAREDLSAIEEARTIATLLDELKITATVLAARLGRSRTDIAHTVRLLELPDEAIELVDAGVLSKGHGKALLTEPDHHRRRVLRAEPPSTAGQSERLRLRSLVAGPLIGPPLACPPTRLPRPRG